jgi:quinol monooxygenase YgiN
MGRGAEFESTVDELVALHGQHSGYMGATLLQSFGNPTHFTLVQRWTERDVARAAVRSEAFTAFARSLATSGLFRPLRPAEAYESVFEVDAEDATARGSACEVLIDWTLKSPMVAPAFEAFSRQMAENGKQHAAGFVSSRLRRFLGSDNRYMAIVIFTDRAAARARYLLPEVKAYVDAHPYTDFALEPPTSEVYEVVKRYAGSADSITQAAAELVAR